MIAGMNLLEPLAALMLVLGLILLIGWLARRFDLFRIGQAAGGRTRLNVLEQRWLDSRNRLVLVACDGEAHLVLLSASGPLLLPAPGRSGGTGSPGARTGLQGPPEASR